MNDDPVPGVVDATAPFLVVLNAGSGADDARRTRAVIEDVLRAAGRAHRVRVVTKAGRLHEIARETVEEARARRGVVVAAGGDGTINAMVQATLGSGCPFGVLPQGTFNYFGRAHGIPTDTAAATRLMLGARIHTVQVGLVNERVFLVNASLGMYPEILEDREAFKRRFGRYRLVAVGAGLVTVLHHHRQLRLSIELRGQTRRMRTPTLFVGNNELQLKQIGISEAPLLEQGQLAAIALRPVSTLTMLWLAVRGAFGRLGDARSVISFAFKRIVVRPAIPFGARQVKVAIDGEIVWLRAPLEFRVAPRPLHLLKPDSASVVEASS
ncbi:MAG: diacylglycerol/lipid kinase family protein [Sphingomonadaceae bacterium]